MSRCSTVIVSLRGRGRLDLTLLLHDPSRPAGSADYPPLPFCSRRIVCTTKSSRLQRVARGMAGPARPRRRWRREGACALAAALCQGDGDGCRTYMAIDSHGRPGHCTSPSTNGPMLPATIACHCYVPSPSGVCGESSNTPVPHPRNGGVWWKGIKSPPGGWPCQASWSVWSALSRWRRCFGDERGWRDRWRRRDNGRRSRSNARE